MLIVAHNTIYSICKVTISCEWPTGYSISGNSGLQERYYPEQRPRQCILSRNGELISSQRNLGSRSNVLVGWTVSLPNSLDIVMYWGTITWIMLPSF
jgi:hypothetical protein